MRTFPEDLWFGFLLLISVCVTLVIFCAALASVLAPAAVRASPYRRLPRVVARRLRRA